MFSITPSYQCMFQTGLIVKLAVAQLWYGKERKYFAKKTGP